MLNIFKKKKPLVVVARLNARLQPFDRGDIEDALESAMAKHGHRVSVVGGGTALAENGEITGCDIEIRLDDPSDATIGIVTSTLEAMLAPKGSHLDIPDRNRRIDFGVQEGLALYLNGTDLPDDVYQDCDVNHVFEESKRLLEGIGSVLRPWDGARETALYMYGSDFRTMKQRLTPFLEAYPLCQRCRIEQIA
jgi:hypothetical protein